MFGRLDRTPFPLAVGLTAIGCLFVTALAQFSNAFEPRQMDFISFWAAGKLVLSGHATDAYNVQVHNAVQLTAGSFHALMPFPYPPPFLILIAPFALLPYGPAALLWTAGTLALFVTAARRISPSAERLSIAFPPVLVNGIVGQNGLLTGALFLSGMALIKQRPLRAGLVLGCLVIKPQLGLLLPLAFVAGGQWRAFTGAAISSVGLLLLALLAFGPEPYIALAKLMPLYASIAADGLVGWHKMASVYASMRLAGAPPAVAWSAHIMVAGAATLMVLIVWRSTADLNAKAAVLASASALISPYMYVYDMTLLLLPLLWLLHEGEDRRVLAILWCIPLIVLLQSWGFNELINPAPLLPIALLALIGRRLRREQPSSLRLPSEAQTPHPA